MILFVELLIIVILFLIWFLISKEEASYERLSIPKGELKEIWEGPEKRKALRLSASIEIRYIVEKKSHLKLNGKSKNISLGGAMLEIEEKLYPSVPLKLEIDLPDDKPAIFAEAEVIWVEEVKEHYENGKRHFNVGTKFLNLAPPDQERIFSYIKTKVDK